MPIVTAALLLSAAQAQAPAPPRRQIPPSVLGEVALLEARFEAALVSDCAPERCFAKGCTYVDHATADRPRARSLPGLGGDPGPGSVDAQEHLTRATCAFTHERGVPGRDVAALSQRLQAKLSSGWLVVTVEPEALPAVARYLRETPEDPPEEPEEPEEPVEEEPPSEPDPWTRELWVTLLPHFAWMIAVFLLTVAASALIWSWRRLGAPSIEDQLLLASMGSGGDLGGAPDDAETPEASADAAAEDDAEAATWVARERVAWHTRLDAVDPDRPDPELQAMTRRMLLAGQLPLLAKASLTFPRSFPAVFPTGGDVAPAKLALADYLQTVRPEDLPSERELFEALERMALSAAVATQTDAELVRSLRDEFGAAGLAQLITQLPPRAGALLFALTPATEQRELTRLTPDAQRGAMVEQLLRSDRISRAESRYLLELLGALRQDAPLPQPPAGAVTDRGPAIDAAGALSVLLPTLAPATRAELLGEAVARFRGALPAWYRGILYPAMLLRLDAATRADLLLGIDVLPLAAWLDAQPPGDVERLRDALPDALRRSLQAVELPTSAEARAALAQAGRSALAAGLRAHLDRAGAPFEELIGAPAPT